MIVPLDKANHERLGRGGEGVGLGTPRRFRLVKANISLRVPRATFLYFADTWRVVYNAYYDVLLNIKGFCRRVWLLLPSFWVYGLSHLVVFFVLFTV